MSITPKGSYSSAIVYDERKRYYVMQAQANRPLIDSEVREMNQSLLAMARRHMVSILGNVASPLETFSSPTGSSGPNNAFKVRASSVSTDSNFTVTGGSGDIEDPAVIYLDGYYVFLKGDVEYNAQGPALLPGETVQQALIRDSYTATPKSSFTLTTPANDRVDVVYIDLSFAEVSGDSVGSEYTDPAIKDPVIGRGTSNRLRAVIDFRVKEGWTGQLDDNIYDDAFFGPTLEDQVQHVKYPIALLHRQAGNQRITSDMITDLLSRDEKRVLTLKELSHRTRHGGYTQADVDAGRAQASDLDETWSAAGNGEGFGTEAFNSDSVTPRVLNTAGHYRVSAISVGASGAQHSPDPELLTDGEVSATAVFARAAALGFSGATASDLRGMSGVVLSVDSRGTRDLALRVAADQSDVAMRVDSGEHDAPSFEVRGSGMVGIGKGHTGPQCELDVSGDAALSGDLSVGGSAEIGDEAFVGSKVSVGLSGILSTGDITLHAPGRTVGLHMGHTGAVGSSADSWAHLVADKDALSVDTINNSGRSTGERFAWRVAGASGPSGSNAVMGLDTVGNLRVDGGLRALGDLSIDGSSEVHGDSYTQGQLIVEGGLQANGVMLVSNGTADAWYEIGSFLLGGLGNATSGSLHLVISSSLGSVGSWEADLFLSASVPPNASSAEGLYLSGSIKSSTPLGTGTMAVDVLRAREARTDGAYRYSVAVSPVYTSNYVHLSVIGGTLVGDVLWTPREGSAGALKPDGIESNKQNVLRILGSTQVAGSLEVEGGANVTGDARVRGKLKVGSTAAVDGDLSVGTCVTGNRLYLPANPGYSNKAIIGLTGQIAGYTGGIDHTIELLTGAMVVGGSKSWGSFLGTDEKGQVGFRVGMGNPQAGRGRARGWVQSDLLTTVESSPALRGIIGIAFDTKGNCIAAIRDYLQDKAVSIVYLDTLTRKTSLLASGFRAISDIKLSVDGFLYVTSELALSSQDYKVARVVLYYGPDGKPTSASVQPIALSTPVFGLAGLAVAKAPMSLNSSSYPAGTLFVVESRSSSARLLAVDPVSGNTEEVQTGYALANVSAIECGSIYGSEHSIYLGFRTVGSVVLRVRQISTGVAVAEQFGHTPSEDQEISCTRKLHLGVDGYLYLVDASDTTGAGKVLRYDQDGEHDLVVSGLSNTRAFCVSSSRMMYLGDTTTGSVYRRAVPGALVVHLDFPTGADDYDFPGDIPLIESAREVDITGVGADVISVYGADFKVDRRLVVEGAAFFSTDVYVDGILHMDTMEVGDFRATSMIVGANAPKGYYWETADGLSGSSGVSGSSGSAGSMSALDVWGDAIVQSMLLVGTDPDSRSARNIVGAGIASSGGVSAYVFGEMQAYDYRAVGQGNSVGLVSLETSDGYIAAFIGGDDSSTYSQYTEDGIASSAYVYVDSAGDKVLGYSGSSGLSGSSGASGASGASGSGGLFAFESTKAYIYNKKVGIHLIDAASLVVDRDGGDVPAFMQIQGDLEVARGVSLRSVQCNAFASRGISMKVAGRTIEDRTPVVRKDFASSTAVTVRASMGFNLLTYGNPELLASPKTLQRWIDSSCGPLGENLNTVTPGLSSRSFGAPELTAPGSSLMDSLDLASLGSIKIRWKGRRSNSVIDMISESDSNSMSPGYFACPGQSYIPFYKDTGAVEAGYNFTRNGRSWPYWAKKVILSYTFESPILGTQDWMIRPSSSDTRSVTVDVSLAEPVHEDAAVSRISSLKRTFQVYLPIESWRVHASNALARVGSSTAEFKPLWPSEPFYYSISNSLTSAFPVTGGAAKAEPQREDYDVGVNGAESALISFMSADVPLAFTESGSGIKSEFSQVAGSTRFAQTPATIGDDHVIGVSGETAERLQTFRWGSGWAVALYPRFKTAHRVQIDSAGNFDWVGTWDLQVSIINTSSTVNTGSRDATKIENYGAVRVASSINGYIMLSDSASGSRPWSTVNPPWKFNEQLPWADEMQVQAAINADKYVHVQGMSSTRWEIAHNLGGYPSVTLQDVAGHVFVADIQYTSQDTMVVILNVAATGRAVLN